MALISSFTFVQLTDKATLTGQILSQEQKNVLYNLRAGVAEQILTLAIDPKDIYTSVQTDAYLKGKLEALNTILDSSDLAELTLAEGSQPVQD